MKYVSSQNLRAWLQKISESQVLQAPVDTEGVVLYQPIENLEDISWDFSRTVKSPKEIFFPQTERLMIVKEKVGDLIIEEIYSSKKTVIFGVRSCDARGLKTLDSMFIDTEPEDKYYSTRRENTTLIGLACKEMGDTCFCTSMGGGPDDSLGMDIMLSEKNGGYLVEIISQKGKRLASALELEETQLEKTQPKLGRTFPVPEEDIIDRSFKSKLWENQSERCLSCRICAYVCPTCRCFDIRDEQIGKSNGYIINERVRCWDSCGSVAYRRIAGGHNPREVKTDRLRNRILCKLHYYEELYGSTACAGCGRCIDACPVNIDITEIMTALMEEDTQ